LPRLFALSSGAGLQLLSRPDCPLCEEFAAELAQLGSELALPALEWVDVDSDPALARRYGLDIPVLLLDGVKVCQHHLDKAELRRLLRPR
jgi:thiol-disulfide isomerase/thioredoxin